MITIIAAVAQNNVIGGGNNLLWHIREDLMRFKKITSGHPVVMGRKTFESLGKALPNRRNVVITRNGSFEAENCETAGSLKEALSLFTDDEEVFVIGGGEIYSQAMEYAGKMYITRVYKDYEGDTYFPEIDASWEEVCKEYHERGESFEYSFEYIDYRKSVVK